MDGKEYLDNYALGAIDTSSQKPILIRVKGLINLLEGYYEIKSEGVKPIKEADIKQAASEYEKIACCEKDHPFLKVYVNEDFVAGAKWVIEYLDSVKL